MNTISDKARERAGKIVKLFMADDGRSDMLDALAETTQQIADHAAEETVALRAEVEVLRADKERLDWVEENLHSLYTMHYMWGCGRYTTQGIGPTARAAIDAAKALKT